MAEQRDQRKSLSDPLSSWREWMSQSETRLNTLLNDVMATDGFGRVMGGLTKVIMSTQKSMTDNMERYFTALSLPTRSDVVELGKRLSMIESRLSAIGMSLEKLAGPATTHVESAAAIPRPPRTRKPSAGRGAAR